MSEPVQLGRALTGHELPLTATEPTALAAELAALGWDANRLAELRRARMAAREPWPFPVEVEELRRFGFARFHAQLTQLRELLGLSGRTPTPPAQDRKPNRDEQRLMADRPPHWG
ncbi:hypothetical protein GCM10028820_22080 [Tessaracoccus terricola]